MRDQSPREGQPQALSHPSTLWNDFAQGAWAWWIVRFLFAPHRLVSVSAKDQGRAELFLVVVFSALVWAGLVMASFYFLNPKSLESLLKFFGLQESQPKAVLVLTGVALLGQFFAWGMRKLLSTPFGQWFVAKFERLSFYLSCLLFDPRMLAGLIHFGRGNRADELFKRILFARLLNMAAWGGILATILFIPIANTYLSVFLKSLGLASLGLGNAALLVGTTVAAIGQLAGLFWEGGYGSKLGTFVYSLLLDPQGPKVVGDEPFQGWKPPQGARVYHPVARFFLAFSNVVIWAGIAYLAVSSVASILPFSWQRALGGLTTLAVAPVLGALLAIVGQVWSAWSAYKDNAAVVKTESTEASLENGDIPLPQDNESSMLEQANVNHKGFLYRRWFADVKTSSVAETDSGMCIRYRVGIFGEEAPSTGNGVFSKQDDIDPQTAIAGVGLILLCGGAR